MKKRTIAALLMAAMLALTISCADNSAGEDETDGSINGTTETTQGTAENAGAETSGSETAAYTGFNYMGNDLTPYITIGNYKGLEATKPSTVLTDEEYSTYVDALLDSMSYNEQIRDRAVEAGETVVTSFAGYMDGVQFNGGTSEASEVTAADGTGMIDGFGPAFVGQMPGVEFSFKVKFPEIYGNLDLAGKEATFVCTIDYIKGDTIIVPELTDEFARANFGCETVDAFHKMCREYLILQKETNAKSVLYNDLWKQVTENSVFNSYPEGEVEHYADMFTASAESTAAMYNVTLEEYLAAMYGMEITREQFLEVNKIQGQQYVESMLVVCQIAKEQGILVTDEELNAYVEEQSAAMGVTAEVFLQYYGKDSVMVSLLQEKVGDYLAANAVITEEEAAG